MDPTVCHRWSWDPLVSNLPALTPRRSCEDVQMQLTPRYGTTPIIALDGDPAAVAEPLIRQRRRFVAVIEGLAEEHWSNASRCEGWSARDVAVHLASTNVFWDLF